jgi:hypothetical protein
MEDSKLELSLSKMNYKNRHKKPNLKKLENNLISVDKGKAPEDFKTVLFK